MQVSFFGRLADLSGQRHLDDIPDRFATGADLRDWLTETHPHLAEVLSHPGTRLVLDNEITDWQTALHAGQDIAIIPVVSGG